MADEDIEVLRLRAKAKAKALTMRTTEAKPAQLETQTQTQPPKSFFEQRLPYLAEAEKNLQGGNPFAPRNPIAATANIGNQIIDEAVRPFTIANEFLRTNKTINPSIFPAGQAASNILGFIPRGIAGEGNYIPGVGTIPSLWDIGKAGFRLADNITGFSKILPQTKETNEIGKAFDTMGRNVATLAAPQIAGKAIEGIKTFQQSRNVANVAKAQAEIKKVAPPTPKELNYDKLLNQATPYIAKQLKETPIESRSDISPIRQATDIVAQAKSNLWNEKIAPVVEKYGTQTIDGTQIANSIRQGLTDYTKNHDPLAAKRIESYAASFEGKQIPISQASQYITELNARTSAYQKAPAIQKTLIENASPNISSEVSAVDALREQVYSKLDELGAPEIRGLKKDYGSLMQVHKALERNIIKAEKGSSSASFYGKPFGTAVAAGATIEGLIHSPKTTAVAGTIGLLRKYLTERNKPNPTIERAFGRLEKSTPTQSNINIEDFPVNPNAKPSPPITGQVDYKQEAESLGIRFDGYQDMRGKKIPQFTDMKTGTTFYKGEGETVAQALQRKRTQFGVK